MTSPRVRAGHAMLAAAMRAKAGEITFREVVDLVDIVAGEVPQNLRYRAAARAFASRILVAGCPKQGNVYHAGVDLHDFLIEDGERVAAE